MTLKPIAVGVVLDGETPPIIRGKLLVAAGKEVSLEDLCNKAKVDEHVQGIIDIVLHNVYGGILDQLVTLRDTARFEIMGSRTLDGLSSLLEEIRATPVQVHLAGIEWSKYSGGWSQPEDPQDQ